MRTQEDVRQDRRTNGAIVRDAPLPRLERIYPTVPRRDPYAPTDVRANADRSTVNGKDRALAARGTTRCVCSRPRVAGAAPERVTALERQQRLWDVCLGDYYGARGAQCSNDLLCDDVDVLGL
jgi:hypothetical protein